MQKIRMNVKDIYAYGYLINSKIKEDIEHIMPIDGDVRKYGDEIYWTVYFDIPYHPGDGDTFERGDLVYWKSKKSEKEAIAIFFGNTPIGDGLRARTPSDAIKIGQFDLDNIDVDCLATGDFGILELY